MSKTLSRSDYLHALTRLCASAVMGKASESASLADLTVHDEAMRLRIEELEKALLSLLADVAEGV